MAAGYGKTGFWIIYWVVDFFALGIAVDILFSIRPPQTDRKKIRAKSPPPLKLIE